LDASIQVDKNEWKAFLEDLSELEKKYELLLSMLDMAEGRQAALSAPEEKKMGIDEASRQVSMEHSKKVLGGEAKRGFLSRLNAKLARPGSSSMARGTQRGILGKPQAYASCSRCGFMIVRPTRFCPRCSADFGKLVCSCGRELSSADRFCDRCGRQVRG